MILLLAFAFLAGIITVLSPCILPILPIILTSTIGGKDTGKSRPLGVVAGFILSFTFFTLFLSTIVRLSGISADALRLLSVLVIGFFGVSLLVPQFQLMIERLFSKLAGFMPSNQNRTGFGGGLLIGLSVGLLWTPCVGPILASVISLAITGTVTFDAFLITLAYALGTAIPMFLIMLGGQNALRRVPWLLGNLGKIQKIFGVLMILTAIGIFFNIDRKFQTFILEKFPQYGSGLIQFEDNNAVRNALDKNAGVEVEKDSIGKPMFDLKPKGTRAPELIPGGTWFNTDPLTLSELKGKVVLIDFWTYTCINCQRTFPYLRDWNVKYQDKGLVIIGVHAPEFEFEKSEKNVAQAIKDFKLSYPIVQDNDFATWRAYNNRYWPAKYILDKDGFIRYTHFGEGAYDETEKVIQNLLKESGAKDISSEINNPTYKTDASTPEIYLGYSRIENFASPESIREEKEFTYSFPKSLRDNNIAYSGRWTVSRERAMPKVNASLAVNYESKEVFLVMRPVTGSPGRVRVLIDGKPIDDAVAGVDVGTGSIVTVTSDRLYKLIKFPNSERHTLTLEFLDGNTEVYAFTFG